eukprot:COSAG02_NODE_94_length_37427_cov_79.161728_23_plen_128_part_00
MNRLKKALVDSSLVQIHEKTSAYVCIQRTDAKSVVFFIGEQLFVVTGGVGGDGSCERVECRDSGLMRGRVVSAGATVTLPPWRHCHPPALAPPSRLGATLPPWRHASVLAPLPHPPGAGLWRLLLKL